MIEITKITDYHSDKFFKINQLYDSSFPLYEKRSYQGRCAILSDESFHSLYFSHNGIFIGFINCWSINNSFYIEHIAIESATRGKGYGQQILTLFCQQYKQVILEIDPLIDDISCRRLRFYQHCHFQVNEYQHSHPSYRSDYEPHKLMLLSYPQPISAEDYQYFNHKLVSQVMNKEYL